jgi:hypothetical protein
MAPNIITEIRYIQEVTRVADKVPTGIDRWVSRREDDRLEPAIIPVTAGKKRPTKELGAEKDYNYKFEKAFKYKKINPFVEKVISEAQALN